jgi:hypothetical protein
MKTSSLVAIAVVVTTQALYTVAAAQDTIYPGGGSATDAYSCFSDCGKSSPRSGTVKSCYCDDLCLQQGDCCADRDEFCTPAVTSAGIPVAQPACSITSNSQFKNFCGTDLGFVYPLNGNYEVLFGDSWTRINRLGLNYCDDRGGAPDGYNGVNYRGSDDAQGTLSFTRPSSVPTTAASINTGTIQNCLPALVSMDMDPNATDFALVTLHDEFNESTILQLPPGQTPLAGFADGSNSWVVFKQGVDGYEFPDAPFTVYLGYRESTRNNYKVRVNLSAISSMFLNVSTTKVTSINDAAPSQSNWNVPTSNGYLLMFTRPSFFALAGQTAPAMYLLRQRLPLTLPPTAKNWAPEYYTGRDEIGRPSWSSDPNAAATVLEGGDFKITNQMDIKWVPTLNKWIMLYGGDVGSADDANRPNDQPRHGAIHMRMADYPWGPWTRATPLLWRESMRAYYECDATGTVGCDTSPYTPGTWMSTTSSSIPGCVPTSSGLQPVEPTSCPTRNQRGMMYAPEMLVNWTNPGVYNTTIRYANSALYFMVSTWMPYQVVLAAADLHMTQQTYGNRVQVQLRDYHNQMIKNGDPTYPSSTAGGTLGGATGWLLSPVDPNTPPTRGPAIGDAVYFHSTGDNLQHYLSRSGDYLRFDAAGQVTLTDRQKWILESTDLNKYPNGTPIVLGKTPFFIKDYDSDRHIKSKGGTTGWRNYVGTPGQDATFTMTWGCILEDPATGTADTCLRQ